MADNNSTRPATGAVAVTASDSTVIPATRALLVGTAGNAKVTFADGPAVTIPLQQGYNPISVTKVWSTGISASNITALY